MAHHRLVPEQHQQQRLHPQPLIPTLARASRDPASQWLVLEPNRIEKQTWQDLWRYRELFAILACRDITVLS